MFTGRYPHANGVMGLVHSYFGWDLRPGEKHLAAMLRDAGYATALAGHQHETRHPESTGWDDIDAVEEEEATDAAIRRLGQLARTGRPFYLQIGYQRPHRHFADSGYRSAADAQRGVTVPSYLVDEPSAREDLAGFQGDIRSLDTNVARVLREIDALGLRDNTWVIFTTDHGIPYPRAKCSVYEAGIETALIMRWPAGFAGSRTCDAMVSNVDYVPTIREVLGLAPAANLHGQSFAGLLRGEATFQGRSEIFAEMTYHQYYDPRRCIRTATHKLVLNFSSAPFFMDPSQQWRPKCVTHHPADPARAFHDPCELYDLRSDPLERMNLAGNPALAGLQDDLAQRLRDWMTSTDDPLLEGPVSSPMHDLAMSYLSTSPGKESGAPGAEIDGSRDAPPPVSFKRPLLS